jgi:hypothetical protein
MQRFLVSVLLAVSSASSSAQVISDDAAKLHFVAATKLVYRASAQIFKCLSDARDQEKAKLSAKASSKSGVKSSGKPSERPAVPDLGTATNDLKDAYSEYSALLAGRANAKFYADKREKEVAGAYEHLKLVLAGDWSKVDRIETEGQIAKLNREAIDRLTSRVGKWDKACAAPSSNVDAFVEFVRAKVLLESASTLAEIAWNK